MLWVSDFLLAVGDVEGTSAVVIPPLTIPGRLVGGSMQYPQLHASLQQLLYHISMGILSCLPAARYYCHAIPHQRAYNVMFPAAFAIPHQRGNTVMACRSCAWTHCQDLGNTMQADVLNGSDDLQCSSQVTSGPRSCQIQTCFRHLRSILYSML